MFEVKTGLPTACVIRPSASPAAQRTIGSGFVTAPCKDNNNINLLLHGRDLKFKETSLVGCDRNPTMQKQLLT